MDSLARRYKLLHTGLAFTMSLAVAFASTARADVSQSPLLLGGGSVPGNLALVPSVEWPTILSMANLGDYSVSNKYVGYFDADKCYDYAHDSEHKDHRDSHFFPKSKTSNRTCSGKLWSGNFLNWAATQTIDPFRSALTGGYRVKDTKKQTWLEKARNTGQDVDKDGLRNSDRAISGSETISGATPTSWSQLNTRISGLGSRMHFSTAKNWGGTVSEYKSGADLADDENTVYEVYIRVKVCDPGVGLETNCKRYAKGYKPEGLIQQYSSDLRYSVFSYLNDHDVKRDGGVMRARQKFVGQTVRVPGVAGNQDNGAHEWDATTGVFVRNPDEGDATNTNAGVLDSGVINYLNKFGQMTAKDHKHYDPVSELFYTALRYFKGQSNVSAYSTLGDDTSSRYELADGFPVITDWKEGPIQYACQKNVILGIGDTNTHRDKNLPQNKVKDQEPTEPDEVSKDGTIDVVEATQKVAELEGITINTPFNNNRKSSAYIAGLAYDAHTKDLRKDWTGKQTVSTHWVDVRENERLAGKSSNPYWLAAKYGGFKVPKNFGEPYERSEELPEEWWHSTTDMLSRNYPRPDNFYVASDAANMVESLKRAFANIANEAQSTLTSLATNSTRLSTDTAVFQPELNSKRWSGDLLAKQIVGGEVAAKASWKAAGVLDALSDVASRKIFSSAPPREDGANGSLLSIEGIDFTWGDLDETQHAWFIKAGEADSFKAEQRLAFLRGDRSLEMTDKDASKPFRQRTSRLGDIVNSDPQFIHQQNFGYGGLAWNDGAVGTAYAAFRASDAYKNRIPMVIVGANDGMLHGFDARVSTESAANGGAELFAYVPNNILDTLIDLTEPAYSHRYYVDATPRVSDVWLGESTGWRTMVVGATGAGGNSVFALDITDPGNMSNDNVMWEFSHPSMGYTVGQPALVALPNQKFGVIVSSGYHDSPSANGKVWILDAANGSVIKEFTLATTGGLGTPLVSDTDADQVADRVYIADTQGNLWRLDLNGNSTVSWGIPGTLNANPLFVAKDDAGTRQAITAPLASAFNDQNQHMVFFGTGSFYRTGDNEIPDNPAVETFYGIIDNGLLIDGRNDLLEQEIIEEATLGNGDQARATTQNVLQDDDMGWYLDLAWQTGEGATGAQGERVIAKASLRNGRVIFTTMTPSADPCEFGGSSWIMAVDLSSGGRFSDLFFDTDDDGTLTRRDAATVTEDGDIVPTEGDLIPTDDGIPWSGISDKDAGVTKGVTSVADEDKSLLCFAGSNGATPTCMPAPGSRRYGRQSWHEMRAN